MSLAMTRSEREAYLAGVHVGIISIERPGKAPLTVPIWYDFDPAVGVWVITGRDSEKGRALAAAISVRPARLEGDRRPMARRNFGREPGDRKLGG